MTTPLDECLWFRANPDRAHRCRLATPSEVATITAQDWLKGMTIEEGCFVYCLVRILRNEPTMQQLFVVLEPPHEDMSEQQCERQWFASERSLVGGRVVQVPQ
jgi:hypothetical protein